MTRWKDEYNAIVIDRHRRGMYDGQVASQMLDMGLAVSKQDVATARRKLGLRANNPSGPPLTQPPLPKEKPNPLALAKVWLGTRFTEKHSGGKIEYRVDGVPSNLDDIMVAFNHMRKAMGMEQILLNPKWEAK